MTRIVLDVINENKVDLLLSLFRDLDYVDAQTEKADKIWKGDLPVLENPVFIPGFTMFSREELTNQFPA